MTPTLSLILAIVFIAVIGYVLVMRVFFRESRALDRNIDYGKMREWKDDDDWK